MLLITGTGVSAWMKQTRMNMWRDKRKNAFGILEHHFGPGQSHISRSQEVINPPQIPNDERDGVCWKASWWELSVGSQSLSSYPEALPKSGVITLWSWNWIPVILVLPPHHHCLPNCVNPLPQGLSTHTLHNKSFHTHLSFISNLIPLRLETSDKMQKVLEIIYRILAVSLFTAYKITTSQKLYIIVLLFIPKEQAIFKVKPAPRQSGEAFHKKNSQFAFVSQDRCLSGKSDKRKASQWSKGRILRSVQCSPQSQTHRTPSWKLCTPEWT